jgi:hypothetical protein
MIGYTIHLRQRNRAADKRKLGVRLGKHCISMGIPVIDLVEMFGVSRQTVYNWFSGAHEVGPSQKARVKELFPFL